MIKADFRSDEIITLQQLKNQPVQFMHKLKGNTLFHTIMM